MTEIWRITDLLRVRGETLPNAVAHDDTRRVLTFEQWITRPTRLAVVWLLPGWYPGDHIFTPMINDFAVEMAVAAWPCCVPVDTRPV